MIQQIEATRPVLWNITNVWVMYALFVVSVAVAGYGVYRRVAVWRQGLPAYRFDRPAERLKTLLEHALGQRRTIRENYAALFHTFIYTGFIILTAATTVVLLDYDFGFSIMRGA